MLLGSYSLIPIFPCKLYLD